MISKNSFRSKVLILLLLPLPLFSWWDRGHMVVAQIAYERLTPEVRAEVDALTVEGEETFVSAACWADDIGSDNAFFWEWHRCSIPYDPDHLLSAEELKWIAVQSQHNVIWAIDTALSTFDNPNASYWSRQFALRLLIHTVADLHQPLHCAELYSAQFPEGDLGGNCFPLDTGLNLHLFWDSMCGYDTFRHARPLSDADAADIKACADAITTAYPPSLFPLERDLEGWHAESHSYAPFVYSIQPGETPSAAYIAEGQEICKARIAAAGYRLAHLLNAALSEN